MPATKRIHFSMPYAQSANWLACYNKEEVSRCIRGYTETNTQVNTQSPKMLVFGGFYCCFRGRWIMWCVHINVNIAYLVCMSYAVCILCKTLPFSAPPARGPKFYPTSAISAPWERLLASPLTGHFRKSGFVDLRVKRCPFNLDRDS